MDYTITITDLERKGLEYAAADVGEWLTFRAKTRAETAIQDIIALNTAHCNANNIAIAVGVEAQVDQAYELGVIQTGAQVNAQASPGDV
jgi:hypothetical protein